MWQGYNNNGQGYPGDGMYRTPNMRQRFQNSPRFSPYNSPRSSPYFTPPQHPGHGYPPQGYRNPGSSPYSSTPDMHRHPHRGSPHMSSGGRGRGRSPHFSPRGDFNPGGSNDITQYYHPSMLEDPWTNVPPVPASSADSASS